MFVTSHDCAYFLFDWPTFGNPYDFCRAILQTSKLKVWILGRADWEVDALVDEFDERIIKVDAAFSCEADVRGYFNSHVRRYEDVFISGSRTNVHIANEFAFGTVLITEFPDESDARIGADWLSDESSFIELVKNNLYGGLIGELSLFPAKSLLPGYSPSSTPKLMPYQYRFGHPNVPLAFSLGRFLRSMDGFKNRHHFTRLIKTAKDRPQTYHQQVSKAVEEFWKLIRISYKLREALIVPVPPKPSDSTNRNAILLQSIDPNSGLLFHQSLSCPRDFAKQKDQKTYGAKAANVRDQYVCGFDLSARHVLLFDDVYTSGSTMRECSTVLLRAGAAAVYPVSLALTVDDSTSFLPALSCTGCGSELRVCFRRTDGKSFWGCANFSDGGNHTIFDYAFGLIKQRKLQVDSENEMF